MPEPEPPTTPDPLAAFSAPTRTWFQQRFGQPTPPQAQGWAAIQRGEHVLILAPTGSGKTLAAFLWGIDQRHRDLSQAPPAGSSRRRSAIRDSQSAIRNPKSAIPGVRLLYISPLKALNNDIERNLRVPLAGNARTAEELGLPFPEIRVAVRSGDTPPRERQAMVRKPPDILITTPESLYLLLTGPAARAIFRTVQTVIVDEIHTLVGTTRGVHLALSLERLQAVATAPVQRIGLTATIQPLEEAARFLGGCEWEPGPPAATLSTAEPPQRLVPRPVTIIDAQYRKDLDLQVISPVADLRRLPGDSLWPSLIPVIDNFIQQHQTTLVFCNSRRMAERVADWLNEESAAGAQRGHALALIEDGVMRGRGMMAAGDGTHPNPIRAHHGSVSRESRLEMEQALKAGELPALVATSSLELGIDIGAVDLVLQIQSPEGVARGLQRVGRAGHLVGQTSKARFFPTHAEDLMATAAVVGGMLRGEVESTHTPRNPLDVLAQQIVAMVSVETWRVEDLYRLVRQAYPYQELSPQAFHTVLEMLAGRYPSQAHRELRARLSWDRVNNVLAGLPGSRLLALANGGTIPDRGTFTASLSNGEVKLGELDEEFVYETKTGDTFMLGSQVWRVVEITDDRVHVVEAPGASPRMPFWRGDIAWRPYDLGKRVGAFRRLVAERVRAAAGSWPSTRQDREAAAKGWAAPILDWLRRDYRLDDNCAWHVLDYVARQLRAVGSISSDRTVVVELFRDALGDPRMVVHSPFGGRVNGPWSLALAQALRERTGVEVEAQSNDDGILLRFPNADAEFPTDVVARMTPAEARERILRELPNSAVFGAQFRQNAARALLLPGARGGKRTPFWLQRLRAKELLQVVRRFDDFPILIETYRDCLQDVMDLPALEEVLGEIQAGRIEVVVHEGATPSPIAQALLFQFVSIFMYEQDAPKAERQLQQLAVSRDLLGDVLKDVALEEFLKPEAVAEVASRLQHTGAAGRARTLEELAVLLQELGDLSEAEVAARSAIDPTPWIESLARAGRLVRLEIPTAHGPEPRWVAAELESEYREAFAATADAPAALAILRRYLAHSGPVTASAIRTRYAFPMEWLREALERLVDEGVLARGRFARTASEEEQYLDRRNFAEIHRQTLTLLRREVRPVPFPAYADFLARWQHAHPAERCQGPAGLTETLQQLRGLPVVGTAWERAVLPARLERYEPKELEELCRAGEVVWVASGAADPRRARVRFFFRGEGRQCLAPATEPLDALSAEARAVYEALQSEGAAFVADLASVLRRSAEEVEQALWELALNGLVTNDSMEALRRLLQPEAVGARAGREPQGFSALEAQLAARRPTSWGLRRPSRSEYYAAKRRVAERLQQRSAALTSGRWSLVHRLGVLGPEEPADETAARYARQLLQRWGVVTRAVLEAEEGPCEWAAVAHHLRLMEMRGEVRRGLFVEGLPGPQYALASAVERLRESRDASPAEDLVVLNACDPANRLGAEAPAVPAGATGEPLTLARVPTTWVVLQRGYPVLVAEGGGSGLITAAGTDEGQWARALAALLPHLLRQDYRVTVHTWNGAAVLGSAGQAVLEAAGFHRDHRGMTFERGLA
ncbi:MAG: DEAD/DEAH box helicase [Armatimonadetes bacterium]|nr:DEAD/DEAH box helicase [Armatimonadota bacterium]